MTVLYAISEVPPPQAVTFTVKESVAAVVGVPVRFSEVVVLDTFAVSFRCYRSPSRRFNHHQGFKPASGKSPNNHVPTKAGVGGLIRFALLG